MYFGSPDIEGGVTYGIFFAYLYAEMAFAGLAMLAVFLYLAYKLESWFLAITGFGEIFMSLPVSFAVRARDIRACLRVFARAPRCVTALGA